MAFALGLWISYIAMKPLEILCLKFRVIYFSKYIMLILSCEISKVNNLKYLVNELLNILV